MITRLSKTVPTAVYKLKQISTGLYLRDVHYSWVGGRGGYFPDFKKEKSCIERPIEGINWLIQRLIESGNSNVLDDLELIPFKYIPPQIVPSTTKLSVQILKKRNEAKVIMSKLKS